MRACSVRCVCGRYSVLGRCEGGCVVGSGGERDVSDVLETAVVSEGVMVLAVRVVAAEYAVRIEGVMVILDMRDG